MVWEFYCGLAAKNGKLAKNRFIERLLIEAKNKVAIGFYDSFSCSSSSESLYFSESESEEDEVLEEVIEKIEDVTEDVTECTNSDETKREMSSQANQCIDEPVLPSKKITASTLMMESPSTIEYPREISDSAVSPTSQDDSSCIPSLTLNSNPDSVPSSQILVTACGLEGIPTTLSGVNVVKAFKVDIDQENKKQIMFTLRCVYETQDRQLCARFHDILSADLYFSKLSLSPSEINAIGYIIAKSGKKWQLHLVNCDITVSHINLLSHHFNNCTGRLTRLYLNDNNLDITSAAELKDIVPALKPLQKLFLGNNSLSDNSFEKGIVPETLKRLPCLECLDLSANMLHDVAMDSFVKRCGSCIKCISHLDISMYLISSTGIELIAENMLRYSTLRHLNVGGNPILDEGIQILAKHLSESSLTYLNVSETSMTDEGLAVLASALPAATSLQVLVLHSNKDISYEGLSLLFSQLINVDVSYCQTGYGAQQSDVFIPASSILKSLDMSYNDLEDDGVIRLLHYASSSTHLTKLAIGGNGITSSSLQILGFIFCESSLKKLSLNEEDLFWGSDEFDTFCECLVNTSLQEVQVYGVENEQLLKKCFRYVNKQRKFWGSDEFDTICECLVNTSLQEVQVYGIETEQLLKKCFRRE